MQIIRFCQALYVEVTTLSFISDIVPFNNRYANLTNGL